MGRKFEVRHLDCDEKSNEIPAVQTLIGSLALAGSVVTVDALSKKLIAQVKANHAPIRLQSVP